MHRQDRRTQAAPGPAARRLSRWAAVVAGVALSAAAAGCGSDDDQATGATPAGAAAAPKVVDAYAKGKTIGFVTVTNCANPTICAVEKAVKAEVKAAGATPEVLEWSGASGTNPVDAMISNMDQLIAKKVDAIGVWPVDPGAVKAPIRRAVAAGIPVFTFDDTDVEDPGIVSVVAQGRALQAKQAAEYICQARPDGGTVLYGDYGLPIPSLQFLAKAFKQSLAACGAGKLKLAVYQNATDDVAGARKTAEPALQSHPDTVAIAGYNDATAIGGSQAAQSLGVRDKLVVAGYNVAPDGVEALKDGRLDVSWDYRPVVMGQIAARQMLRYATGKDKSPPKLTVVWPKCYDKKTIAEAPGNDALLKRVGSGEDLAKLDADLIQTGTSLPEPGADLPGCPTAGG